MARSKFTVRTKHTTITTEITVERETVVALGRIRTQRHWCHKCFSETPQARIDGVAAVSRVTVGAIHQWAAMGRLHFADANADAAALLVCLNSFAQF